MSPTPTVWMLPLNTRDGVFTASYSATGLCGLSFPGQIVAVSGDVGMDPPRKIKTWHRLTESAVNQVLEGVGVGAFPPFDLDCGTPFQQKVWAALQTIELGSTKSYGEIARVIGQATAMRAVGGACGANPVPLLIPCHRVLAVGRKIGGFSGGIDWKKTLLKREGITFA